jgi:hypothetical protein
LIARRRIGATKLARNPITVRAGLLPKNWSSQ